MRKPFFCICENKTQINFAVTAKLISAFVFATRIVQSLYFLYLKFQASIYFLWLHSPVCVGPGRKPRRPVFSQRGSNISDAWKSQFAFFGAVNLICDDFITTEDAYTGHGRHSHKSFKHCSGKVNHFSLTTLHCKIFSGICFIICFLKI